MKKSLIIIWLILTIIPFASITVYAQDDESIIPTKFDVSILSPDEESPKYLPGEGEIPDQEPIVQILLDGIRIAVQIIGSVAILAIVAGGIVLITAGGNDNQLQKGKTIFLYAILGLIIALASYIITTFIQSTFY